MAKARPVHFRQHIGFYCSALLGGTVWLILTRLQVPQPGSLAGDTFFIAYLAIMLGRLFRITPSTIRRQATWPDEGIAVIVTLTLFGVALSLGSLFSLLRQPGDPGTLNLVVSVMTVPLGWTTLHTIMASHYAHLFYARHPSDEAADAGGLLFPQTEEPGPSDFLYYSFVVGMTAQVSDVQVTSTRLRRTTLVHGVVSFFFNAVIVAVAVNVAIGRP